MTSGTCVRCGRAGIVEYGSDGMSYCSSCIFYGLNKQCGRCRMYLPESELQQYRGLWACPYCIQDMRDEDRRSEYKETRPKLDIVQIPEQCERCGRDLDGMVYIWNGKKLCRKCLGDEQESWGIVGGGPMGAPQRVSLAPGRKAKKTSVIETVISEVLHITGLRKKPKKVQIVEYTTKMPISRAKPMNEKPMRKKEDVKPEAEGLMSLKGEKKKPEDDASSIRPRKSRKKGESEEKKK